MPYTPDPQLATQPVDTVDISTAAAEFRALKSLLQGLIAADANLAWAPTLTAVDNCSIPVSTDAWYMKIGRLVTLKITGTVTITAANAITSFTFPLPFAEVGTIDFMGVAGFNSANWAPGGVHRASAGVASVKWSLAAIVGNGAGIPFTLTLTYLAAAA